MNTPGVIHVVAKTMALQCRSTSPCPFRECPFETGDCYKITEADWENMLRAEAAGMSPWIRHKPYKLLQPQQTICQWSKA